MIAVVKRIYHRAKRFATQVRSAISSSPLKIRTYNDGAARRLVIREATQCTTFGPKLVDAPQESCAGNFPPVRAYLLRNVYASAYSSGARAEDMLFLPGYLTKETERTRTCGARLFEQRAGGHAFAINSRLSDSVQLNEGLLIGGPGAFNWYHFLIECLPKAYLSLSLPSEFSRLPLIVPEECAKIPTFAEAIALFQGQRDLIFLGAEEISRVGTLGVIDDICIGPFNMPEGEWPRPSDFLVNQDIMREYATEIRCRIFGSNHTASSSRSRKLFLARSDVRRKYNQNELINIAIRSGLEVVCPETLSLTEQAELFRDAAVVVGASGAAWSGLIFAHPGLRGLSWLPRRYFGGSTYSNLAAVLGHDLHFIEATPDAPLVSTTQAYWSGYTVCPKTFESSLARLLEE